MMEKLFLALAILATTCSHASAKDLANDETKTLETPQALCTISLYEVDPALLVGTKYKLMTGEYLMSDCDRNARFYDIGWWQLTTKLVKEWNAINQIEQASPAEDITPANKEIGHED